MSFLKALLVGVLVLLVGSLFAYPLASANTYINNTQINVARLCDENGANCNDVSSGFGGGGYWTQSGDYLHPNNLSWKVGIGTNNPQSILNVNVSSSPLRFDYKVSAKVMSFYDAGSEFAYSQISGGQLGFVSMADIKQHANQNLYLEAGQTVYLTASGSVMDIEGTDIFFDTSGGPTATTRFSMNGDEKMRLDSNGNLGIGTSSPGERLDVNGSINATGDICITGGNCLSSSGGGSPGGDNMAVQFNDNGVFGGNVSKFSFNKTSGYVGIGTSNPAALLELDDASPEFRLAYNGGSPKISFYDSGSQFAYIQVASSSLNSGSVVDIKQHANQDLYLEAGDGVYVTASNNIVDIQGSDVFLRANAPSSPTLRFYLNGSEKARFNEEGNLGIGMANPTSRLSINGSVYIGRKGGSTTYGNGHLILANRNATVGDKVLIFPNFVNTGGGGGYMGGAFGFVKTNDNARSNDFIIYVADTDNVNFSSDEVFRITNAGNVGIGEDFPAGKLHVKRSVDGSVLVLEDSDGMCYHDPESGSENVNCFSDERLKENIQDAPPVLDWLMNFRVRRYNVKVNGEEKVGVIAQEVRQFSPDMVKEGPSGYLMVSQVNPWKIVKAIQELKQENDYLKAELCQKDSTYSWCLSKSQRGWNV